MSKIIDKIKEKILMKKQVVKCKMCKHHEADYKNGFCSPLCEIIFKDTTPEERKEKWSEIHGD